MQWNAAKLWWNCVLSLYRDTRICYPWDNSVFSLGFGISTHKRIEGFDSPFDGPSRGGHFLSLRATDKRNHVFAEIRVSDNYKSGNIRPWRQKETGCTLYGILRRRFRVRERDKKKICTQQTRQNRHSRKEPTSTTSSAKKISSITANIRATC